MKTTANKNVMRSAPTRSGALRLTRSFLVAASALALVCLLPPPTAVRNAPGALPTSLPALLGLTTARLAEVPLERVNLLCAQGLPGASLAQTEQCAATLSTWADRVRAETDRHLYRFRRNPAEFENSEGFFRMVMMGVVLAGDFGVRYSEGRKSEPGSTRADDGFFADASEVFLHGLLGPERQGTCSSMPVLFVAVGRHLGYPLSLVTTKAHLFVRWEAAREQFNVEATGHGVNRFSDDYYRHWPFEVRPAEEAAEGYLKSLTPAEELAVFLSIRGLCLRDNGRLAEAAEAFAAAVRLHPACRSYGEMFASLNRSLHRQAALTPPPLRNHQ